MEGLVPMSTTLPIDADVTVESRRKRLAVAGILMDLLEYSAFDATRAAGLATPEQRDAIIRAADWGIREQARDAVRHHVKRIRRFDRSPDLRVFGE